MKITKYFAAAATLIALAAPATAADIAARPYTKAPVMVAQVYDWTGFYVGGEVGGAWRRFDGDFVTPPFADFGGNSVSRGIGGGFVGLQMQMHSLVFGIEGSAAWLFSDNYAGGSLCNPLASCNPGSFRSARFNDPIWTFGGRIGYAAGAFPVASAQWMPYITGGYAETKIDMQTQTNTGFAAEFVNNAKLSGYYVGVGADFAVSQNWIFGLEYRHFEFDRTTAIPVLFTGDPNPDNAVRLSAKIDTIMARLSYKFNWAAPVVAKY